MNTIHEIQSQIEQCEARAEELRRALDERRAEILMTTAHQILDLISTRGLSLAEVMPLLKPTASKKATRAPMNSMRWIDPQTGVGYVRGPVPAALKQRMADMGFNGSFKTWRDQHMQVAN